MARWAGEMLYLCWAWFLWVEPLLSTSWSRCPLRHLRLSWENIKTLHKLSKCCRWWCGWSLVCLSLDNCRNQQCGHPTLDISLTEVVSCIPPSRLRKFSNLFCFCRKLPMQCWTVVQIVPITQLGLSSSLSLPSSESSSSSSSSSPCSSLSELARSISKM